MVREKAGVTLLALCAGFGLALVLVLSVIAAQDRSASAADFGVTRFDDPPPDGCAVGDCSLREAIIDANAAPGPDAISLDTGTYALSIPPDGTPDDAADGDLDVTTGDLTIAGAGEGATIIDGGGVDRVFHLNPLIDGISVEISGVTIQGGLAGDADGGGGIRAVGDAFVTLSNVTVAGNEGFNGGGIFNVGPVLTLNGSTVSGNTARQDGGGIANNPGTVTLSNSTVSGNTAVRDGGGILNAGAKSPTTLSLNESAVTANIGVLGGGIYNGSSLFLTNVTISSNLANSNGAGLHNTANGSATVNHATIAQNTAIGVGGGIYNEGTATVKNTIVSGNGTRVGNNCSGAITSAGNNIFYPGGCGPTLPSDITDADPLLENLADNGGPTKTMALLAGSPAIDKGSDDCPPPATDQRGVARPLDGDEEGGPACDIGAYEFEPPAPATTPTSPAPGPTATVGVVVAPPTGVGGGSGSGMEGWLLGAIAGGSVAAASGYVVLRRRRG